MKRKQVESLLKTNMNPPIPEVWKTIEQRAGEVRPIEEALPPKKNKEKRKPIALAACAAAVVVLAVTVGAVSWQRKQQVPVAPGPGSVPAAAWVNSEPKEESGSLAPSLPEEAPQTASDGATTSVLAPPSSAVVSSKQAVVAPSSLVSSMVPSKPVPSQIVSSVPTSSSTESYYSFGKMYFSGENVLQDFFAWIKKEIDIDGQPMLAHAKDCRELFINDKVFYTLAKLPDGYELYRISVGYSEVYITYRNGKDRIGINYATYPLQPSEKLLQKGEKISVNGKTIYRYKDPYSSVITLKWLQDDYDFNLIIEKENDEDFYQYCEAVKVPLPQ